MKKLGLIGGMSPESTIPYYHDIVYGVKERLGENVIPELSIESVNVFKVLRLCEERKYDEMADYLMTAINNLVAAGADFIALSANTPHIVFDKLNAKSPVKLISIVEAVCDETIKRNLNKIGLIGTIFTMQEDFFKKPFFKKGIEIVTPTAEEMNFINNKILNELEVGIIKESTQKEFLKIIDRMKKENGIKAIVLGCTEIPLLLNDDLTPVPCLDTMKIHIQALIEEILRKH